MHTLEELRVFMDTAEDLNKQCEGIREVHASIIRGLSDQIGAFTRHLQRYVDLSTEYNNGGLGNVNSAASIQRLVDQIVADSITLEETIEEYATQIAEPSDELKSIQSRLKSHVNSRGLPAIGAGGTTGITLGTGITATLVAVESTAFGAAGAFVVAGALFPPALVILGGAIVLAGIGVGLAALIRHAIDKGKKKLLRVVTQLIEAIMKIQTKLGLLRTPMTKVRGQLKMSSSVPQPDQLIDPETINVVGRYASDITETFSIIQQVPLPTVPSKLLPAEQIALLN